jgi:uncharacterized protein
MDLVTKLIALEECVLKFSDDKSKMRFSGLAAAFGNRDSHGDVIRKGAFRTVMKKRKPCQVRMHVNHMSWLLPVGKWTAMSEKDAGLFVEGELTPGHSQASDVWASMKHGTVTGMSVAILLSRDGVEKQDDVRYINDIVDLPEISIATAPSNPEAQLELRSATAPVNRKQYEMALRSLGFTRTDAEALSAKGWSGVLVEEPEPLEGKTKELVNLLVKHHGISLEAATWLATGAMKTRPIEHTPAAQPDLEVLDALKGLRGAFAQRQS